MRNADRKLVQSVVDFFRENGFEAETIPERTDGTRTPDVRLSRGVEKYLVEVKAKNDDPERIADRKGRLIAGEIVDISEKLSRRNTVDSIVDDGVKQLAAEAGDDRDVFRLILVHCEGSDADAQARQIFNTAYGHELIICHETNESFAGFYLRESAFYRCRDGLDGILLACGDTANLWINDHSPRYEDLKRSSLATWFRDSSALTDPRTEEGEGRAFIADCPTPRSDEHAVVDYLQRKYGRQHMIVMPLGVLGAMMLSPAEEPSEEQ
jgi:hypothetical protein